MACSPFLLVASIVLAASLRQAACLQYQSGGRLQGWSLFGRNHDTTVAQRSSAVRCPTGCTRKGVCNEELGRCDCPRHLTGPACSTPVRDLREVCAMHAITHMRACTAVEPDPDQSIPCFNSCHGRGTCLAGFCHCWKGFWGPDCSLSMGEDGRVELLAGQGYKPRKTGVKIYVYDLPGNVSSWFNFNKVDRPLPMLFIQRLQASGALTTNGDEADYYYIPVNSRSDHTPEVLRWMFPYIQKTWPYWNRDNGHRHFIIHPGDMGVVDIKSTFREEYKGYFDNVTWVSHWGLHTYHNFTGWKPAHRPGKDIVIPVLITSRGFHETPLSPANIDVKLARNGTLFFAGRVCGDQSKPDPTTGACTEKYNKIYSAHVRQRVYEQYSKRKGFKLVLKSPTYLQDISSHKFCLAPTGGGHGKRQVLAILMGCIPVTITDHVLQPFEPEINWSKFSVPVPEADIPKLDKILGAIDAKTVSVMQSRLHCVAQHMWWSGMLGGILGEDGRYDAFETLLEILRVRKEHPGVPPEKFTEVDERFRKFVDCDLGSPKPEKLCVQNKKPYRPDLIACSICRKNAAQGLNMSHHVSFYNWPGGAACCDQLEAARCPRVWP